MSEAADENEEDVFVIVALVVENMFIV